MRTPRLTVLMPVFNGGPYLREAIDSVLQQTFRDFEFLIVDDGSSDDSREIAESYADPRIRLVRNERNLGLVPTLNKGLDLCRGDFVARMDCDDIALPQRLQKQVEFMDARPDVGLCGTWSRRFQGDRTHLFRPPTEDAAIRFQLLFDNVFYHNTVLLRRKMLLEHGLRYDPAFRHAEDYEFWVRCARHTRVANLPEVLVLYRFHADNTSNRFRDLQRQTSDRVRTMQLEAIGLTPGEAELGLHLDLLNLKVQGERHRLLAARDWLNRLATDLTTRLAIPQEEVVRVFSHFWYGACGNFAHDGLKTWTLFLAERYGRRAHPRYAAKLLLRCLLRRDIPRD